jgi:hypothetical protein
VQNLLHRGPERYPHENANQITEEYLTRTAQHGQYGSAATLLTMRLGMTGLATVWFRFRRDTSTHLKVQTALKPMASPIRKLAHYISAESTMVVSNSGTQAVRAVVALYIQNPPKDQ